MSTLSQPYPTPEQYLTLEREADHKSEYVAGETFAMSGASEPHNVISVNATRDLKGDQQWLLPVFEYLQATVPVDSLNCVLEMALLYENVDFASGDAEA